MRKKSKIVLFTVSALAILGAGAVMFLYTAVKGNAVAQPGHLYLGQGVTYEELMDSLSVGSVRLKNPKRFDRIARGLGANETVQPGHYYIRTGMDYLQLARTFQRGWQTPVRVTFNNARTLPLLAGKLSRTLAADSLEWVRAFNADTMAAHYDFTDEEFIGMFVPNTYEMYWTISPTAFMDRMKREYDAFWTDDREQKRRRTGLSRGEVITLASIVHEETLKTDEMPRVAGVYLNRLNTGMILQADPTLKFAVGDFTLRRILDAHKAVDSPYNTYKYAGLPPGPIAMPSVAAIDAVLGFEEHNYYYFCAREDFSGYHHFARTLAEHNRNADRYHAALNRNGIR
jgi:UPF0755 protein